jgi:hypothetical protein
MQDFGPNTAIVDKLSRVFANVLSSLATPILLAGENLTPDEAAAPDGLLPAFLLDACSVWETISGNPIEAPIRYDPDALMGVRVADLPDMPATVTLACMTESAFSVLRDDAIVTDALLSRWSRQITQIRSAGSAGASM